MKFGDQRSSDYFCRKLVVGVLISPLLANLAPGKGESARKSLTTPQPAVLYEEAGQTPSKNLSCLPKDVRADEPVSYGLKGGSIVTVAKKLAEMKARCRRGKLVDAKRREIRFFRVSCWGNPPADYQEIQKRENDALAKLKKRYAVIVFACNPMIQ